MTGQRRRLQLRLLREDCDDNPTPEWWKPPLIYPPKLLDGMADRLRSWHGEDGHVTVVETTADESEPVRTWVVQWWPT